MLNSENDLFEVDESALQAIIAAERKECALAVALRLGAIALRINTLDLNGTEAAELLRQEAECYEREMWELH
ncbi:DUF2732 family protein [Mixta intestinalis]|jgi:hypothetical protein|uniref:DUF2732 domain-containing protein n=1 Tax=Mixta intestinalis TaxID=1615494 RepID=A0A6P1Q249_9GAMM|nr:DUF2732 family protein [Mixta intestinalis]QHM72491.1 hypothetical protein C7M51_02804 [Mixta intestinalis]